MKSGEPRVKLLGAGSLRTPGAGEGAVSLVSWSRRDSWQQGCRRHSRTLYSIHGTVRRGQKRILGEGSGEA